MVGGVPILVGGHRIAKISPQAGTPLVRRAPHPAGHVIRRALMASAISLLSACQPPLSSDNTAPNEHRDQQAAELRAATAAGALVSIRPDESAFDMAAERFSCVGARRETVSFSLQIGVTNRPLANLDLRIGPLVRPDGATLPDSFHVSRVHAVDAGDPPGWLIRFFNPSRRKRRCDDIIVPVAAPRGGLPAPLRAGDSMTLWAQMRVPDDAMPGLYTATISILDQGAPFAEVPLQLEILPTLLPNASDVELLATIDVSRWPNGQRAERSAAAVDLLRSHGVSAVLTHVHPIVKINASSVVTVDWRDFDAIVGPLMTNAPDDRGPPTWCRIPFDDRFPTNVNWPDASPAIRAIVEDYLRQCAAHFADRGWLDRSYVELPSPDSISADAAPVLQEVAGLARRADRRLRTFTTASLFAPPAPSSALFKSAGLDKLLDIWCPSATYCDPRGIPAPPATWFTIDRPPYSGTLTLCDMESLARVIPWQGYRYDIPRVMIGPAMNDAQPASANSLASPGLVYDGEPFGLSEPVPSMRLKYLQRGMQDVAYMTLLRTINRKPAAAAVAESICRYALSDAYRNHHADVRPIGWEMRPQIWQLARRVLIEEASLTADASDARNSQRDIHRRQLSSETRRLDLLIDGIRLNPARDVGSLRLDGWVTLDNGTTDDINGLLAFADLPLRWRAQQTPGIAVSLPSMSRRRIDLAATADSIAWDSDGLLQLPIALRPNDGGEAKHINARLAYIASQRASRPYVIDGDLSDWLTGSDNVAGAFRPITGQADEVAPTRCLVSHDDDRVYFAITTQVADDNSTQNVYRNFVQYEDMIPTGEDIVEILIDPSNAGAHSPQDIYHLVFKQGGPIFERGVALDPPVGERTIWPADIRYASRRSEGTWTIEASVPRAALNDVPTGPRIWGINFTRFDKRREVYATWSGARHNVYDPLSFGNLLIP